MVYEYMDHLVGKTKSHAVCLKFDIAYCCWWRHDCNILGADPLDEYMQSNKQLFTMQRADIFEWRMVLRTLDPTEHYRSKEASSSRIMTAIG